MPSDERTTRALAAVAGARDAFRSSIAMTVEEVRGLKRTLGAPRETRGAAVASELGTFADGRIDTGRFADLLVESHHVEPFELTHVDRALEVLASIQSRGEEAFRLELEPGAPAAVAVAEALGSLGRAFGAARVIERVRDGRYKVHDAELLEAFPFERWNRAERAIAPPLVVELDGADLRLGGVADFLDGSVKLVFVVRGDSPPAPLARLITPGVLVIQTDDPEGLAPLSDFPGSAVAALVPESAARFIHRPAADGRPASLEVDRLPEPDPRRMLGGLTPFQQGEELRQLAFLAQAHGAATGAAATVAAPAREAPSERAGADVAEAPQAAAASDPAGALAAWLLRQADLSDLGSREA